ncbi:MAG: NAD(P)H-dependent oxidoreductase [Oscillibacter sp.]|nr:NAD(P)H-dependent oxidoreductase [Oscillibacter sp.]
MKLLFVDCCISQRGKESRTLALAKAYIDAFRAAHPDWEVERADPMDLPPLTAEFLDDRDTRKGEFSAPMFAAARQFQSADSIVVAAPYWDLSYPAQLKTYIEHISANGLCYHYTEQGCQGDCKAEKLVYLTSGGDFEGEDSVGVLHWKQLCKMFGIETFTYVFAGGMDIDPVKTPELLAQACEKARSLV